MDIVKNLDLFFLNSEEAQKILDEYLPGYKIIVKKNGEALIYNDQGELVEKYSN